MSGVTEMKPFCIVKKFRAHERGVSQKSGYVTSDFNATHVFCCFCLGLNQTFVGRLQENSQHRNELLSLLVEIRTPDHVVAQLPPGEPDVTRRDVHGEYAKQSAVYMCVPPTQGVFRLCVQCLRGPRKPPELEQSSYR